MKKLISIITAIVMVSCTRKEHKAPPPGWHIVCNARNQFAAQRDGSWGIVEVYDFKKPTRQNALDRAWGQYEYENERRKRLWDNAIEYKVCP